MVSPISFTIRLFGMSSFVFLLNLEVCSYYLCSFIYLFIYLIISIHIDLCENSALVFTVWTSDGKPFGSCTMQIFNEFGALKSGKQKLIFYYDRCADTRIKSETKGELYDL